MIQSVKPAVWGLGGFTVGAGAQPVLAQIATTAATDIPALPAQWETGLVGFVVALLVWALRKSDQERINEAREFAAELDGNNKSRVAAAERHATEMDRVRAEAQAFTLQLHKDLMAELRRQQHGSDTQAF